MSISDSQLDQILQRINDAIDAALRVFESYPPDQVEVSYKSGDDPITRADTEVDSVLKNLLSRPGEGWLSEETTDDPERLTRRAVWVVDPLDGTREFVSNIPEWCVSIGYVWDGIALAGGICNPSTGDRFVGALGRGVLVNGTPVELSKRTSLRGATIPASRSEIRRGEWEVYASEDFNILPTGSSAYKLALVASGRAEASWTLVPKNEWDVAGGVALVHAAGGICYAKDGYPRRFNQSDPILPGLVATAPSVAGEVAELLGIHPVLTTESEVAQ
jgi:myo-inositol-1(or 4)-monophosphatase